MADTKITALAAIATVDPAADVLPIVDISDTSMAASGTTKKVTTNQILQAGGTATLASATITGDLTVDTSTLKVDSTNNRVGIGTASPAVIFDVTAVEGDIAIFRSTTVGGNDKRLTITSGGDRVIFNVSDNTNTATARAYVFQSAGTERYRIAADGVATWSVAGTTAMTLNANGLGVGGSPNISASGKAVTISGAFTRSRLELQNTDGGTGGVTCGTISWFNGSNLIASVDGAANSGSSTLGSLAFSTGGSTRLTIDSSGNVGIGVTPSAWASMLPIQIRGTSLACDATIHRGRLMTNAFFDGAYKYIQTNNALLYTQDSNGGSHSWYTAPSGTAGAAVTFTQAMTLDASGNLLVGNTSSPIASRVSLFTTFAQPDGIVIRNTGATAGLYWRFGAVNNSNTLFVMNASSVGVTMADGASAWSAVSDERFKDIIEPISNAVSKVGSLRSVIGKYKSDSEGTRRSFLIAQDVKSVLPEAVDSTDSESLGLRYTEVIPLLVAAIQELTAEVNALKNA